MTNAEKFEKIFGLKVDDTCPDEICGIIDHSYCVNNNCDNDCPAYDFWNREYIEPEEVCDNTCK